MGQYQKLIQLLDKFIRKYYLNQLLRGVLLLLIGSSAIVLILGLGEYFLYLSPFIKITLLSMLILGLVTVFYLWIFKPLLAFQGFGKIISKEQAASIIGQFFPDVKDKLLNILQLHQNRHIGESEQLAFAGIEQKAAQISVVPMLNAVNIKENKRFLPWLLPGILLIGLIAFFWPQVFKDSASRLAQPTKTFHPPAPFSFQLNNKQTEIPLGSDYTVSLKTIGEKLPGQVNLIIGNESFVMQNTDRGEFSYTLYNVKENVAFHFNAAGFYSDNFQIKILERPQPKGVKLSVVYPAYTHLKNETLEGFSNISVPSGTHLTWTLNTQNTESINALFHGQTPSKLSPSNGNDSWSMVMTASKDSTISFILSNKHLPNFDTLSYSLQVLPDRAPQITAQQDKDSISQRQVLITGAASDDYGLSKLLFHYTILDADKKTISDNTKMIQPTNGATNINYYYYFDINDFNLLPGQTLNYFIEAWDNDAVHGSKKAVSEVFSFHQENNKELDKSIKENNEAINKNIASSHSESENINREIEKFREQMLQSPSFSWEQQNQLKSLADRQKEVQNKLESLKKRFEMQQKQSKEKNYSEDIKEKQKELEKQLDKIQNKDLADMMKKLQDMMNEKNKESTFQKLEQWQQENKLFQMNMERIQELMKQLALQMKLEDMAQKAKDLSKTQENLANKTQKENASSESLKKEQKDLQKQLEELMNKDFSELKKQNNESQSPQDLSNAENAGKQAGQEMQNSQNSLDKDQKNDAGKQQKNASKNLKQMSKALSQAAKGMDMDMIDINIKAVRQLLTNLLRYSFEQEHLLLSEKTVPTNISEFEQQIQTQHTLKQNSEMIKDSLFSLSKRVFQIAPTINKETTDLTKHLDNAISQLENRRIREARVSQQFAMTNANNLALLLDETLRNLVSMQMQAQGQEGGDGSPSSGKPGKSGKGKTAGQMMQDIITGQQQMGKGMSEMGGQTPGSESNGGQQNGKGQSGSQGGENENGNSGQQQAEKLARLAQQQAEIRNMMQQLSNMLNSQGNGQNAKLIQEIQKAMNQNEIDLVNRNYGSQLKKRQQDIITRLLEAQDAIRNQQQDNKRVAESGNELHPSIPPELKIILEKRKAFLESYQTVPAGLKPFYKKMVENYQRQIGSI